MTTAAPLARSADARRILQSFECKPTAQGLPANALPDELRIDWRALPAGAEAQIYLPAAAADDILAAAARLYFGRPFTRIDAHTINFRPSGVIYIPIPAGQPGANYAGLMTLTLPAGLVAGHRISAVVRQLTTLNQDSRFDAPTALRTGKVRQEICAFQINATVQPAADLLKSAERSLAFFRWVIGVLPKTDRYYPVLLRYLAGLAASVDAYGGNATSIAASQSGAIPEQVGTPVGLAAKDEMSNTGKIECLIYDRFGDFEGFVLETDSDEKLRYHSRESHIAELANWVWNARIRITVFSQHYARRAPTRILLHAP
jgi:hypothetical protein